MTDFNQHIIKHFSLWTLYIHQNQCYLGRCYLALKRDGNLDPFLRCTDAEWEELRDIIANKLSKALEKLFQPDMYNYDNLRNTWQHCHWHVIPRYSNERNFVGLQFHDKNWGANWSPYDTQFLIGDEKLFAIRDAIAQELE